MTIFGIFDIKNQLLFVNYNCFVCCLNINIDIDLMRMKLECIGINVMYVILNRVDRHHYVRDSSRYQRNQRRHDLHPYTNQEWFPSHDRRSQYEHGPRYDSQNDTISWDRGNFGTERRRHEAGHRRQLDYRNVEIYHTYDRGHSRINESGGSYKEYHRERDDRNTSRVRNRKPSEGYRQREEFCNNMAYTGYRDEMF